MIREGGEENQLFFLFPLPFPSALKRKKHLFSLSLFSQLRVRRRIAGLPPGVRPRSPFFFLSFLLRGLRAEVRERTTRPSFFLLFFGALPGSRGRDAWIFFPPPPSPPFSFLFWSHSSKHHDFLAFLFSLFFFERDDRRGTRETARIHFFFFFFFKTRQRAFLGKRLFESGRPPLGTFFLFFLFGGFDASYRRN